MTLKNTQKIHFLGPKIKNFSAVSILGPPITPDLATPLPVDLADRAHSHSESNKKFSLFCKVVNTPTITNCNIQCCHSAKFSTSDRRLHFYFSKGAKQVTLHRQSVRRCMAVPHCMTLAIRTAYCYEVVRVCSARVTTRPAKGEGTYVCRIVHRDR